MDEPDTRASGITVTGSGSASIAVDEVTFTVGIYETRQDAGEAFQAAARTATGILAVLADDGADSRSVRTADLTLGPQVEWRDGREVLLGYQASQRLQVHLHGLSGVERMLTDVATAGGGVRIENLQLTPSDPDSGRREAREAALAETRSSAEQLARLVDRPLGRVRWVTELPGPDHHHIVPLAMRAASAAKDSMPIAAGDTAVSVTLTAHWDFAD